MTDARIALGYRSPDLMGSFTNGLAAGQYQQEVKRAGDLNRLYADMGPQIMAGQPQAMNALAQFSPEAALGMRQTQQDMAFDAEAMQMRRAEAKRQADALLAQNQAELDEATAAEHRSMMVGVLAGGAAAYDAGPESFSAWAQSQGIPLDYNGFLPWAAQTAGEIDALDEYVTVAPKKPEAPFRPATADEAGQYGAAAGQFGPDGRFYPVTPPSSMTVETTSTGGVRLTQGPNAGGRPLTEAQSKDNVYATQAEGALKKLDPVAAALTSYGMAATEMDPTRLTRNFQSDAYQQAKQAGLEFLTAILRKQTGAAVTADETRTYGEIFLPQPGDGAAVLEQKAQARLRAVNALRSGMSPEQILAVEQANRNTDAAFDDAAGQQGGSNPGGGSGSPTGLDDATLDLLDSETRAWLEDYLAGTSK